MGLGDAEVRQQERHRLGGHRAAAVGVDGQLIAADLLLGQGVGDQPLGQDRALAVLERPADRIAAVDVEDRVEVEVGPL